MKFKKINELEMNYEINCFGEVRNVKSKRNVKVKDNRFTVGIKGKKKTLNVSKLILSLFKEDVVKLLDRQGFKQISKNYKGIDGKYFITKDGKVFNYELQRFIKPYIDKYGYERVSISGDGKQVHRLVLIAYKGLQEGSVNHIDSDRLNNNISNLEWSNEKHQQYHALYSGDKKSKIVHDFENDLYFISIGECGKFHKIDPSNISRCLHGTRKVRSKKTKRILKLQFVETIPEGSTYTISTCVEALKPNEGKI